MGPLFASLLRVLMIGSVGYSAADLLNYFRAKKAGEQVPAVGGAVKDIFFSWRFLMFLGILLVGGYFLLMGHFKKTQRTGIYTGE